MRKIHMETEIVTDLARRILSYAQVMQESNNEIRRRVNQLSYAWLSPRSTSFVSRTNTNLRRISQLVNQLSDLAIKLNHEVEQWLETDYSGYAHFKEIRTSSQVNTVGALTDPRVSEWFISYEKGLIALPQLKEFLLNPESGELPLLSFEAVGAWAALEGRLASELGTINYALLDVEAGGQISSKLSKDGLEANAEFDAYTYLASFAYDHEMLGIDATATGFIGASIAGEASLKADLKGFEAKGGADIFLGGKAAGELSTDVELLGGAKAQASAHGSLSYGLGVTAEGEFGFYDRKFKLSGEIGVTFGIGGSLGIDVELDFSQFDFYDLATDITDISKQVTGLFYVND